MIVSCFMTTFSRFDTVDRWVSSAPLSQIAVAVDQVADPDQVVVEVTEVALGLGGHARQDIRAAEQVWRTCPVGG